MPYGPAEKWSHIGDGVYVCHDGYQVWLGANEPRKQIALEPGVFAQLQRWAMENFSPTRAPETPDE